MGCDGGWPKQALNWEKGVNVCSEDSYPYQGVQGSCSSSGCSVVLTLGSIWGAYSVDADEGSHCAAVIQGPLSVCVDAEGDFSSYSSGIFDSCGASWGLGGYILISRPPGSGAGTCGIQSETNGVYVYGPYNPSSQIRGADGEFIEEPIRKTVV